MNYIHEIFEKATIRGIADYLLFGKGPDPDDRSYEERLEEPYMRFEKAVAKYDKNPASELLDLSNEITSETASVYMEIGMQIGIKVSNLVATITTGTDGTATGEPLYLGKFEIKETKAPHGMALNPEPQTVELVYAGQEVEITSVSSAFYNERQRVQIDLSKVLEQDEKFGIGQNGEILSVQFGLYAAEDITAADGMAIPKDGLIEIASCDENGKAVFATDLPVGAKLYVKEYSTDEHYLISDEIYPVEFAYAGQETAVVNISVNDGQPMENKLIRGSVIGKKIDEDGFAICGAIFGLFKADETEFTEDTAILTAESNEIGVFGFENVPFGNWIIRELKAAPAFVLNETTYPVTISENEEIVEIEIENRFIVGSVQTTKVDAQQK